MADIRWCVLVLVVFEGMSAPDDDDMGSVTDKEANPSANNAADLRTAMARSILAGAKSSVWRQFRVAFRLFTNFTIGEAATGTAVAGNLLAVNLRRTPSSVLQFCSLQTYSR